MAFEGFKRTLGAIAIGAAAFAMGAADRAEASTLKTAIVLSVDGSGSISSSNFTLQTSAYANLLSTIDTDGSIAIGVRQFSTFDQLEFAL